MEGSCRRSPQEDSRAEASKQLLMKYLFLQMTPVDGKAGTEAATAVAVETPERASSEPPPAAGKRRVGWWLDLALFLALFLAALPLSYAYTRGDFWGDECSYALASEHGFQANRWDLPDKPGQPSPLVILRHYHPPLTALAIGVARHWGNSERTLRLPFVLAGELTVGLIYLCGLTLFEGRREIGVACAALLAVTPAHLRASSHAIPWAFIILWLIALLWTMLGYARTRRPGWLAGTLAALGAMFVTSEMFFPALLAVVVALPVLLWPDRTQPEKRKPLLAAALAGLAAFFVLVGIIWPAGLLGGMWRMFTHYALDVANLPVAATIGGQTYTPAPKWAYLYWYWNDYRPYFLCYALGLLTALILLARRKLSTAGGVLLIFTAVILLTAHKAHILGPEYFVHCLPPLTLLAGLFFLAISRIYRPLGIAVIAAICLYLIPWRAPRPLIAGPEPRLWIPWREHKTLSGVGEREQLARWPAAARFLAARWRPGDRLLIGPQPQDYARWYVRGYAGVPARDDDLVALPARKPSAPFLKKLLSGGYRYVVISSTFHDRPAIEPAIYRIIQTWPIVWQSDEQGKGPSRLIIYTVPPGVSPRHPLPPPRSVEAPALPAPADNSSETDNDEQD